MIDTKPKADFRRKGTYTVLALGVLLMRERIAKPGRLPSFPYQ